MAVRKAGYRQTMAFRKTSTDNTIIRQMIDKTIDVTKRLSQKNNTTIKRQIYSRKKRMPIDRTIIRRINDKSMAMRKTPIDIYIIRPMIYKTLTVRNRA